MASITCIPPSPSQRSMFFMWRSSYRESDAEACAAVTRRLERHAGVGDDRLGHTGLEGGARQQLVEQHGQPADRRLRPLQHALAVLGPELAVMGEQGAHEAAHDRERCAQLVGYAADEVALLA